REGDVAATPIRADQPQKQQQALLDRDFTAALIDEVQPLRSAVEHDAEVGTDGRNELLDLADRLAQQRRAGIAAVGRESVRRHRFDAEWPQQQRQHKRRSREAVVDYEPKAARADRVDVDAGEKILRVCLPYARRIRDRSDVAETDSTELAAREVLLDLLLQCRRELDPRLLEEADLDHLGIGLSGPDMEARLVPLALAQVARDVGGP